MDKNTFMRELEQALSVLQKDEIKDILSEYEQHIDMKVKNGLSEEEAIADFGSLPELTADILSAYHVRADYAEGEKKPAGGDKNPGKGLEKAKESCAKAGETAVLGLKGGGIWLWGVILFWKRQFAKPFAWMASKRKERREQVSGAGENGERAGREESYGLVRYGLSDRAASGKLRRMTDSMGKGIGAGIRIGAAGILWGIRFLWNMGWIGISLCFAFCGLCLLFILGLFVVLLFQRYPLAGLTIGCFGAMLCMFSAAGLGLTFLWRRKRDEKESDESRREEGEQYA